MSNDYTPHYSGSASEDFWERVTAVHNEHWAGACFALGCALQDLEHHALTALENAEALDALKAKKPRKRGKR